MFIDPATGKWTLDEVCDQDRTRIERAERRAARALKKSQEADAK